MTKREAYQIGRYHGREAALYCEPSDLTDGRTRFNSDSCECDGAGGDMCAACLSAEAFEAEQNARQYEGHYPHGLTEAQADAYDAGVAAGIAAGVKARLSGRTEGR